VKEGELLARLDDRNAKAALESAAARLDRSRADAARLETELGTARSKVAIVRRELLASTRELERIESLQGQDAATASDYDKQSMATALRETALLDLEGRIRSLKSQLERNKAESREAQSSLERARLDVERAEIRAPHGGRIESRLVHPGDHVAPGAPLFELVDLSRVEIPVALAAMHFGAVREKAAAEIRLSGQSAVAWAGTVDRVGPTVSSKDRTFYVYLVVGQEAAGGAVPPGAFVSARIEGRRFDRVFVIPRSAMLADRLYIARDGIARAVTPHILARLPHAVLVDEGLREGEMLIASNLEEVADGTRVTLSTTQATDAAPEDS
jgi:RND family efflux transporter MFP subunit